MIENLTRVSPLASLKHDALIEKWKKKKITRELVTLYIISCKYIIYIINRIFLMCKIFLDEDNLLLKSIPSHT